MPIPKLLRLIALSLLVTATSLFAAIDRHAVIERHAVHVTKLDPESPLTVGNGDFAFTVDATGLQSFETLYLKDGIPLETLSTWAWHSFPNTKGYRMEDTMVDHPFHGRTVKFAGKEKTPEGTYFRQNPHPIPMGQISFIYEGRELKPEEISAVDQKLDLWTGRVTSRFMLAGQSVEVETVAHGERSALAVHIKSALLAKGALQVRLRFPYSHDLNVKNKSPFVWDKADSHKTELGLRGATAAVLKRSLDEARYFLALSWNEGAAIKEAGAHDFRVSGSAAGELTLSCDFVPEETQAKNLTFTEVASSGAKALEQFWSKGAAVDFSASRDPRAMELERRIVLSLYLIRANYSGAFPPAESGLTHISWYGKHNTEMYFWHAAQFYMWGHTELLERGLAWYNKILPLGKAEAAVQGFEGVRWPKMAGPDARPTPGGINPYIIWNQPNPIYLCELVYRSNPSRETLEKYKDIVFESAKFLASFAFYDAKTDRFVLGPPIKNVGEKTGPNSTQNPTFELAFWHYGLTVAQTWRERLGMGREARWDEVLRKLSKLPVKDGFYLEIETVQDMYKEASALPTSMLLSLGYMPKTDAVDLETARRTFHEVNKRSKVGLKRWVSWSLGQGAMTAARLNEPSTAVDIVTNDAPAARFMGSGHVRRPAEPIDCPAFLPVNAALLAATGLMLGGWDGAPSTETPGFPKDGSWTIKVEGFNRMP